MKNNASPPTPVCLEPAAHDDGVRLFMDYFHLNGKRPELIFLQEIIDRFATIPYENISKIIKLYTGWNSAARIRLPGEVIDEHITSNLGGTCFSLTFSLQTILTQNGFQCYPVMADMRAGENIHCCLVVVIDGTKFLVDPGYLLHQPMEINPAKPKMFRTEFAGVELRQPPETGHNNLYTFDEKESKWRYRFLDRPTPPEEFLRHWNDSFWKPTLSGIILTKVQKEGLLYVHNTFMRETTFQGKRNINIKKNYHAAIHDHFGIDPRIIEQAQAALQENLAKERELGIG